MTLANIWQTDFWYNRAYWNDDASKKQTLERNVRFSLWKQKVIYYPVSFNWPFELSKQKKEEEERMNILADYIADALDVKVH